MFNYKQKLFTKSEAPVLSAPALLSQGIISNGFIFTAGFIHLTHDGKLVEGSIEEMFAQVMHNVKETLNSAGADLDDIVKVTLYVTNILFLKEINQFYPTYFKEPFPVREAVCVKELPLGAKIEMSVVAELHK